MKILQVTLISLLVALAGCTSMPTKNDDDQTGEAGRVKSNSESPAKVYTSLAVEYMRQGRLDIALQKIKQGVNADPRDANAHNVMGLIYQRLGKEHLAEKHFRRSIRLDPHNFYSLNAYGSFLCGKKRYADAYEQFDKAVKNPLNRRKEIALTNAGLCYFAENKRSEAESYLRKALQANPRHAPALAQMAEISYDLGDYASARRYLKRYRSVARHTAKTLWVGVRTERKLGDRNAEASYRMQLRNRYPDSKEFRLMREMTQ